MFINVHFILGSIENCLQLETTIEENDGHISTSVRGKMIHSSVQVSQNLSEEFVQGQLSFQTEELVVPQGHNLEEGDLNIFESELKAAEENKLTDLDLPHNGIVQNSKLLMRETSEDTQEPNQKEE